MGLVNGDGMFGLGDEFVWVQRGEGGDDWLM